jgi:hypothetical protein
MISTFFREERNLELRFTEIGRIESARQPRVSFQVEVLSPDISRKDIGPDGFISLKKLRSAVDL